MRSVFSRSKNQVNLISYLNAFKIQSLGPPRGYPHFGRGDDRL